jgi:hypothetical protein
MKRDQLFSNFGDGSDEEAEGAAGANPSVRSRQ